MFNTIITAITKNSAALLLRPVSIRHVSMSSVRALSSTYKANIIRTLYPLVKDYCISCPDPKIGARFGCCPLLFSSIAVIDEYVNIISPLDRFVGNVRSIGRSLLNDAMLYWLFYNRLA